MKTSVTKVIKGLPWWACEAAFRYFQPDIVRSCLVKPGPFEDLISTDPKEAGNDFVGVLKRMDDRGPLNNNEKAYLPWMTTLRQMIRGLGAYKIEVEQPLAPLGGVPRGVCDLRLRGGPQSRGVIEVKVVTSGEMTFPRGRHLAQTGAYARLLAGYGSFDAIYAALAYVELETHTVRLIGVTNARRLISSTLGLLGSAQGGVDSWVMRQRMLS